KPMPLSDALRLRGLTSERKSEVPAFSGPVENDYIGYRFAGDRIRFLEQAAFGPTVALDQRIRRIGIRTWLAEQFEAPYPS
ncbi:hypothetical protein OFM04_35925, partial [Escherichia coli]|nr:hypothetical protein [Escherichia coli]